MITITRLVKSLHRRAGQQVNQPKTAVSADNQPTEGGRRCLGERGRHGVGLGEVLRAADDLHDEVEGRDVAHAVVPPPPVRIPPMRPEPPTTMEPESP